MILVIVNISKLLFPDQRSVILYGHVHGDTS
jgi:hypothetical protein